jgi:hypothetical protein
VSSYNALELIFNKVTNSKLSDEMISIYQHLCNTLINNNQSPLFFNRLKNNNEVKEQYQLLRACYIEGVKSVGTEYALKSLEDQQSIAHFMIKHDEVNSEIIAEEMLYHDCFKFMPNMDVWVEHEEEGDVFDLTIGLLRDKEGLVYLDDEMQLKPHGIIYRDKLIYYHQFLRRFFNSNFVDTPKLLRDAQLAKDKLVTRIRLDPIRISTPNYLMNIIEEDFWWGQAFDESKMSDPMYVGVTVHGRNDKAKQDLDMTYPIDKTIFYLKNYKNGKKELQIEELVPVDSRVGVSDKYVIHRFAHLIWNTKESNFEHLDCSVLIYNIADHALRIRYEWKPPEGVDIKAKRMKLFRTDGSIGVEFAKDLVSQFFRYNEMIEEYFTGKNYVPWYEEETDDAATN